MPLLEALLQQGADVNAADDQGISALHQAAKSSPCAVLEALLAQDAAINLQDKVNLPHDHRGSAPLCVAQFPSCKGRHHCSLLLREGFKLLCYYNRITEDQAWLATNQYRLQVWVLQVEGKTTLHFAAERGMQAAMFLVEQQNRTHHKGSARQHVLAFQVEGKTPLHFAAERGVQAAVKLLLDKGASAVIADSQGRLPFQLASGKTHSLLSKEAERQGGSALKHR